MARMILILTLLLVGWLPAIVGAGGQEQEKAKVRSSALALPRSSANNDIHGDPMPAGARARIGSIRLRHSDPVDQVVFSQDGKWLASHCRWEKSVKVWATAAGKLRHHMRAADVVKMTFAPDGNSLAIIRATSAFTGEILVECWDLAAGKRIMRIRAEDRHAEDGALAFSADGKHLYFGRAFLRRLDLANGKVLFPKEADAEIEGIAALALAADGATLVTAHQDGSVCFRHPHTGKERCRVEGVCASHLAFSGDGKTLVLAIPDQLESWQVPPASGQVPDFAIGKQRLAKKETGSIIGLALAPDAKHVLALSADGLACLWDVPASKQLVRRQLSGVHTGALAFDAAKRALAVTADDASHGLRLWNVAKGEDLFAGPFRRMAEPW